MGVEGCRKCDNDRADARTRVVSACERYIRGEAWCRKALLWGNNNIIDSGTLNSPVTVSSYPCGSAAAFVVSTIVAMCWHVILSQSLFLTFSSAVRDDVSGGNTATSHHICLSLNHFSLFYPVSFSKDFKLSTVCQRCLYHIFSTSGCFF